MGRPAASNEPVRNPPPSVEPAAGTRLSADEIYENVRVAAEAELERPAMALFWSSIAAGLTIGFSFVAGAFMAMHAPPEHARAFAAVGYPLGFIFVVLARNQLFTENTLEPIIPLLNEPTPERLRSLLSLWTIVLVGNLLGAAAVGWLFGRTPVLEPGLREAMGRLAIDATSGGFRSVTYRAVFAGWLIALMAWLISSTRATGAQVMLVWLTTAPISAFGFRHSIAGAVEAFYRIYDGSTTPGAATSEFLVPAVLGNVVGGFLFVALLNHGQVAAGRTFEKRARESFADGNRADP